MDQAIQPVEGKPLLARKGATFTRIVVNEVQAADGVKHSVMFVGTGGCRRFGCTGVRVHVSRRVKAVCASLEEGTLVKAVNYDGEMFIIEEVQVFQPRESIKILKFSNVTVSAKLVQTSIAFCILSTRGPKAFDLSLASMFR